MQIKSDGLEAVFFDLDGTLRVNDPPALDTFYSIASELGFETDVELRRTGERWVNEYWADSDLLKEDIARFGDYRDNSAFWENHAWRHLRKIGAQEHLARGIAGVLTRRMREEYQPRDLVPDTVFPTLQTIRDAGLRLGLVSNRSNPMNELVDELGLSPYFDIVLAAGEVGWYKPDPRLLQFAASQVEANPATSIYVGDNYHADVLGARAAGMQPVLIDPRGIYEQVDCPVIRDIAEVEAGVLKATARAN